MIRVPLASEMQGEIKESYKNNTNKKETKPTGGLPPQALKD